MEFPDFNTRELFIILSGFILAVSIGILVGSNNNSNENLDDFSFDRFSETTVNSSQNTATVQLQNSSVNLMFEDSDQISVYWDFDKDGSADKELNITSNGVQQTGSTLVTKDRKSYRVYYRYLDGPNTSGEDFFTVYRVLRVQ